MKVNILIGAAYAYACIETNTRSTDIRLEPGRSAHQSLREHSQELRARARRLIDLADTADQAANILEQTP